MYANYFYFFTIVNSWCNTNKHTNIQTIATAIKYQKEVTFSLLKKDSFVSIV